jgi:competence protein ComGC
MFTLFSMMKFIVIISRRQLVSIPAVQSQLVFASERCTR